MLPASLSARWVPQDFVDATRTGGVLTLLAYALMLVIFTCELLAFVERTPLSSLLLDSQTVRPDFQINFNIDVHGVGCRNVNLSVVDEMRQEVIDPRSQEVLYSTLDTDGMKTGVYAHVTGVEDDGSKHFDRRRDLERLQPDPDWADSDKDVESQSLEPVLNSHDFTLVNFLSWSCTPCQRCSPEWKALASELQTKMFTDRQGKSSQVAPVKLNCMQFADLCKDHGVDGFPTLRLYKPDGSFAEFEGECSVKSILPWLELVVKTVTFGWNPPGGKFSGGCNIHGHMKVPRVPGHVEFAVGRGAQTLVAAMTNTSHTVRHFSFVDPTPRSSSWPLLPVSPGEVTQHNVPLDGQSFCTLGKNEVYEHHLKIVSVSSVRGITYQFVHFGRTAVAPEQALPHVRFHYDFEPFAIRVGYEAKKWYDFATSLLSLLGGVFVLMRLSTKMVLSVGSALGSQQKGNGLTLG